MTATTSPANDFATDGLVIEIGQFWTGGLCNQIRLAAPLGHCHIHVDFDGLWVRTARKPSRRHRKVRSVSEMKYATATNRWPGDFARVASTGVLRGLWEMVGRYTIQSEAAPAGVVADYIREHMPEAWEMIVRDLL